MLKRFFVCTFAIALIGLLPSAEAGIEQQGSVDRTDVATLTVMHAIPQLPSKVEVFANGGFVDSFDFSEVLGPLQLPAGVYDLQVRLGGVPVLNAVADIDAGENYTAIAHLTENAGITLGLFKNDASAVMAGKARLTLRHTAAAPEVGVSLSSDRLNNETLVIRGFANSDQIGPVELPAGTYLGSVLAGGDAVADTGALYLEEGVSYIVYAVGQFPETFEFFVQIIK
jgi:hypothetical protein